MSGTRPPAPGGLEVVRTFVNTVDREDGVEEMSSPGALAAWLHAHGLLPDAGRPSRTDLQRALAVREAVRELLLRNNGEATGAGEPTDVLEAAAARARFTLRFEGGNAQLVPGAAGIDGALGRLLAIVHGAMADGSWSRLKACRAGTCQWAFYDHSRNGSATWCDMAVCGSREKMRSYRRRQSAHA